MIFYSILLFFHGIYFDIVRQRNELLTQPQGIKQLNLTNTSFSLAISTFRSDYVYLIENKIPSHNVGKCNESGKTRVNI